MREFAKSLTSAGIAMSLFAARQVANVITQPPRSGESDRATQAFNAVAQAAVDQCSESLRETYHAADKIQREAVHAAFRVLSLDAFTSYGAAESISGIARQVLDAGRSMLGVGADENQSADVLGSAARRWLPGGESDPSPAEGERR